MSGGVGRKGCMSRERRTIIRVDEGDEREWVT